MCSEKKPTTRIFSKFSVNSEKFRFLLFYDLHLQFFNIYKRNLNVGIYSNLVNFFFLNIQLSSTFSSARADTSTPVGERRGGMKRGLGVGVGFRKSSSVYSEDRGKLDALVRLRFAWLCVRYNRKCTRARSVCSVPSTCTRKLSSGS